MNPSVSYPISVLFLLLLTLFLSSSFASHADDQDEDPFKSCEPFDCGKELKEISYPFRGKHQPEYCGYPGFVLDCESDPDSPVLDVVSQKFRVLDINQKDRVLKIARMDFWDSYCPENFINTTLNSTPFQYTPKDKNTTLFCDCNKTLSNLFHYNCPGKNVSGWACFVPDEPYLGSPDFRWPECSRSVVVPITEEVVKGQVKSLDELVRKVFQRGFEVEWKIKDEDKCRECLNSHGRCGYNSSTTDQDNHFMCFCPLHPQSDELTCGPPHKPVPESLVYPAMGPDPEKSQKDANFTVCDLPYECGNVKNLSFPFWGDDRPQSCGHPGFELHCERGDQYPVIDIDKVKYRVLNVSQENSTMILARSDLWDSPCSPGPVNTTFTPPLLFNYTQGVVNLTLFYHCPKVDLFPYNLSCPGRDVGDNSYYHEGDFVNDDSPFLNELRACGSFVKVPVFEDALDNLPDQDGLDDVARALRKGFGLNYTEFPLCRACAKSGGRCGTSDYEETFCCYCRYGTEESACPLDAAEYADFTTCGSLYECGYIKNLSFPFWGDDRPEFCGHEGFQLRCENREYPVINISGIEYGVLNVSQENRTMTLARSDLWGSPCSGNAISTTLNYNFFLDYAPTVEDLTLIYGCPKGDLLGGSFNLLNNFSCPEDTDGKDRISYYARENVWSTLNHTHIQSECGGVFQVPVFRTVLDKMESSAERGIQELKEVLNQGFDVNYIPFPLCSECEKAHGRCGTNTTNGNFTCYCSEGPNDECLRRSGKGRGLNWKLKVIIGVGCGFAGAVIMCVVLLLCFRMRRKREQNPPRSLLSRDISSDFSSVKDAEKGSTYFGVHLFSYEELVEATNNFDTSKELGDGGFGTVYYGKLHDGRVVAVKRLYENNFRRVEQFKNEIAILARLRHRNLVSLYGCTSRHSHELLLVYEYIPNGTVADHLHGQRAKPGALPWAIRLNIATETACALTYLHASDIIHRDVKTNNILLDNNFSVKVADFGLSRLFPTHVTHISTAPQGTPGYVDPEYHQCYQLTSKSDVFSFGVVMMELVSSMPAVDITRHRHDINLSTMAMNRIQNHALHEIVDPTLGFDTDSRVRKMITAVAELAFQCLQHEKDLRPSMVDVLEELKAIQSREYSMERAEKIDAAADDAVLLMSGPHPLSPDSVVSKWESSTTTPNASS